MLAKALKKLILNRRTETWNLFVNDFKAAITYYFTVLFEVFDKEKITCNKSLLPEKNGSNKVAVMKSALNSNLEINQTAGKTARNENRMIVHSRLHCGVSYVQLYVNSWLSLFGLLLHFKVNHQSQEREKRIALRQLYPAGDSHVVLVGNFEMRTLEVSRSCFGVVT